MKTYQDLDKEVADKILSRVQVGGGDECWNWTGSINQSGRPTYVIEKKSKGIRTTNLVMVQHLVLEQAGTPSSVKIVDTTCGNPICCNPSHLRPRDFQSRFWDNIKKNENDCWIWQGDFHAVTGYGRITIDKKSKLVHRVAYEAVNGEIPDGLMVLHSVNCTSRLRINPDHLRVGTHDDNMKDMVSMSRSQRGDKNTNTILTESQVLEIKQKIRSRKVFYRTIAAEYGVSRQAIKDIALGRTWKWLEAE